MPELGAPLPFEFGHMLNDGQCTGVESASDPMILEAGLLSDPTTPTVMQVDNPMSAEEAGTAEVTNPHAVPTDNAGGDHVAANVVATCEPLGHTAVAGTGRLSPRRQPHHRQFRHRQHNPC